MIKQLTKIDIKNENYDLYNVMGKFYGKAYGRWMYPQYNNTLYPCEYNNVSIKMEDGKVVGYMEVLENAVVEIGRNKCIINYLSKLSSTSTGAGSELLKDFISKHYEEPMMLEYFEDSEWLVDYYSQFGFELWTGNIMIRKLENMRFL